MYKKASPIKLSKSAPVTGLKAEMAALGLSEKDRERALGTFLDNNMQNSFLAIGTGEEQKLEIERLRRQNASLKRQLNEAHFERKRQCHALCVGIMSDLKGASSVLNKARSGSKWCGVRDQVDEAYMNARFTQLGIRMDMVDNGGTEELACIDAEQPQS